MRQGKSAALTFVSAFLVWCALGVVASAQQMLWIQLEAHPTRADALGRAPEFAAAFDDVAVFALPSGWHAIAIGPQTREAARARLADLLGQGRIPADSYIVSQTRYAARVWPDAGGASATIAAAAGTEAPPAPADALRPLDAAAPDVEVAAGIDPADIQRALIWFGHDPGQVDGVLGPASRTAFVAWQRANGGGGTRDLVIRWQAELARAGLATVVDEEAGLAVDLPLALVRAEGRAAPLVTYAPGDPQGGPRLALVSLRDGPQALTDILGVLSSAGILPPAPGPVAIADGRISMRLAGAMLELDSAGGALRGVAMAWPLGQAEEEMARIAAAVARSLRPVGTRVLPAESAPVDPALRLALRPPPPDPAPRHATGVRIDASGAVLTAAAAVSGCARVTLGGLPARVAAIARAEGVALLVPEAVAPEGERGFARLDPRPPAPGGAAVIAGFAPGGSGAPPVAAAAIFLMPPGADGEGTLHASMLAQDAGAAVLDGQGAMAGLLLAPAGAPGSARYLGAQRIVQWLEAEGYPLPRAGAAGSVAAPGAGELSRTAAAIAVEVACAP